MAETLIEGLLHELNRCRKLLEVYKSIPNGTFGAAMIEQDIKRAENAIADNDIAEMVKSYQALKECQ